jgi:hypothetical protein
MESERVNCTAGLYYFYFIYIYLPYITRSCNLLFHLQNHSEAWCVLFRKPLLYICFPIIFYTIHHISSILQRVRFSQYRFGPHAVYQLGMGKIVDYMISVFF